MKKLVLCLSVVGATVGLGCGSDEATCRSALENAYSQGCAIGVGGDQLSRSEAIDGCESEYVPSECKGVKQEALECLADIKGGECDSCDGRMSAYNRCMSF